MSDAIRIEVDLAQWAKEMQRMERDRSDGLMKAAVAGATVIKGEMRVLIAHSPATGRVYMHGTIPHQASAGGEPPATDTGNLVNGITVQEGQRSKETAEAMVGPTAEYAEALERGTSRMAARPYMRPAVDNNMDRIATAVDAQLKKALR